MIEPLCQKCGAMKEQHDSYAQAIGAKLIYVWSLGIHLPVVDCDSFQAAGGASQGES
jgi:hypothetical protein